MKRQNRQFTKFISLLKFPGLQNSDDADLSRLNENSVHNQLRDLVGVQHST